MSHLHASHRKPLAIGLVVLQLFGLSDGWAPLRVRSALAASPDSLANAQEAYRSARFDDAVQLIDTAIGRQELSGQDLAQGYVIMGRSLVRLGRTADADTAFYRVLNQDPTWTANPKQMQADEVEAFTHAKERWVSDHPPIVPDLTPKGAWWKNKWVIIGGVAVLVGVICLILCPGNPPPPPGEQPLPNPPPPPGG